MYVIDGIFFAQRMTGVQRFALNTVMELDRMVDKGELKLVVPADCDPPVKLKNIEIVKYGKRRGYIWEQTDLARYLKKEKSEGIFLQNNVPVFYRHGIVELHDVSLKAMASLYCVSVRHIISLIYWRMIYRSIIGSGLKICTQTRFCKDEILREYRIDPERIYISYNGWQHMNDVGMDTEIISRLGISVNRYYFSMSSMAVNKNIKWIIEAARQHPGETFVIAGNTGDKLRKQGITDNVIFPGYLSDSEAKALMNGCKAFLFPSFYEGFGMPPMEALASGAPAVILSDIPCLREVYGDIATYIDPADYNGIELKAFIHSKEEIAGFLEQYSWEKTARRLLELIRDNR